MSLHPLYEERAYLKKLPEWTPEQRQRYQQIETELERAWVREEEALPEKQSPPTRSKPEPDNPRKMFEKSWSKRSPEPKTRKRDRKPKPKPKKTSPPQIRVKLSPKEEALSFFGLELTSSYTDVKRRYRELALLHHPDKGGDEEHFKKIQHHYSILESANRDQ
jgi:DnaJ-domain-containing protein 1